MFPATNATPLLLEVEGLCKSFGGVQALVDARLVVSAGEIHALVGENGAGKSTLIRILAGLIRPDRGRVLIEGKPLAIHSPAVARACGIAVIHQDFDLPPNLSVIDSLLLGQEPDPRLGFVRRAHRRRVAKRCLEEVHLDVDLDRPTGELSASQRQLLVVARALRLEARILVMDEPTSALAPDEAERLLDLMRHLRSAGLAIIFVSHKLNEVFEIAERVTVLRDGMTVGAFDVSQVERDDLVTLMVGRELSSRLHGPAGSRGPVLMEASGLRRQGSYEGVSFGVRSGEILGLYGLRGAGRTALLRGLFGLDPFDAGEVRMKGQEVRLSSPREAIREGIALVPEDRKSEALIANMSCGENLSLSVLDEVQSLGFLRPAAERRSVDRSMAALAVRATGPDQPIAELSGGNQQKIVLGRWLLRRPDLLLLDEPTAGIDVGAKAEIFEIIRRLASQGRGVVLATSEMTELLGVCDRILVMADGRIVAEFDREAASEEAIMRAIQGN